MNASGLRHNLFFSAFIFVVLFLLLRFCAGHLPLQVFLAKEEEYFRRPACCAVVTVNFHTWWLLSSELPDWLRWSDSIRSKPLPIKRKFPFADAPSNSSAIRTRAALSFHPSCSSFLEPRNGQHTTKWAKLRSRRCVVNCAYNEKGASSWNTKSITSLCRATSFRTRPHRWRTPLTAFVCLRS